MFLSTILAYIDSPAGLDPAGTCQPTSSDNFTHAPACKNCIVFGKSCPCQSEVATAPFPLASRAFAMRSDALDHDAALTAAKMPDSLSSLGFNRLRVR